MQLNWKIIAQFSGMLLLLNGFFMLLSIIPGAVFNDGWKPLLISGSLTIFAGLLFVTYARGASKIIAKKDGFIIVTLGWLFLALSGCLPYIISGVIPSFTSALFETISGYTTTGASVLNDIESVPHGILMWRSTTHWIGGMGIIVLTVAILPILGIGGMQLFSAEAPGVTADKLHPRITGTAKRLWYIYVGITITQTVLLKFAGMEFFDAMNHSMATVSTGGFSTKSLSMAAYNHAPLIQYIVIFFMFLSGVNFALTYWGIKGKLDKIYKNEEFLFYLGIIVTITLLTTIIVMLSNYQGYGIEEAFRHSIFQVIAFITTTGFVTADFTNINNAYILKVIFFLLLFVGGCAGSTAGGVKIVRHLIILRNSLKEFQRLLHPNAVIPVRLNGHSVTGKITFNVMAFIIIYLTIFALGCLAMSLTGLDFESAIGAAATSLGNVGPGLGAVGPASNFSVISPIGKMLLCALMLIGRLEIFTVLIIFTPYFWSKT